MAKPITIFSSAQGLNTVSDPTRISFNNGVTDLQAAINISIDQSGRVNQRTGTTLLQAGSYHSLFCDGGDCFVVKDSSLYRVNSDDSLTIVTSGLTADQKMDFAQVGARTYYTNGYEKGFVHEAISNTWTLGAYTGPETNRQFSEPPTGTHLATFNGRMFISEGKVLWWSEPFNFDIYDQAESFAQFFDDIVMVQPVAAGIFVSTTSNTYFLGGASPRDFTLQEVAQYPALEWSNTIGKVDAAELGFKSSGLCAVWASQEGAILGFPTGQIFNLNKNKVVYPDDATTGFGCLRGYNFIHGVN